MYHVLKLQLVILRKLLEGAIDSIYAIRAIFQSFKNCFMVLRYMSALPVPSVFGFGALSLGGVGVGGFSGLRTLFSLPLMDFVQGMTSVFALSSPLVASNFTC